MENNIEKVQEETYLEPVLEPTLENSNLRNMGIWDSVKKFEGAQRMAKALSTSTMVPKEYQGNLGNCLIALDMSERLQLSPFAVMQSLYLVNGRPSWSAQFITTVINKSGRYRKPLSFEVKGKGDTLSCFAHTEDLEGNRIEGVEVTMAMAKDEGWISKNGSKWKTMPEQMIRYRAASFFGRLHCPDLIMGVYAEDEIKSFTKPEVKTKEKAPDPFKETTEVSESVEVNYIDYEGSPFEEDEDAN